MHLPKQNMMRSHRLQTCKIAFQKFLPGNFSCVVQVAFDWANRTVALGTPFCPAASPHAPPLLPATSTALHTLGTVQLLRLQRSKCDYLSGERLLGSSGIDPGIMAPLSFTYFSAFSDWLFLIIAPMDLFQNQHNICSSAEINGKEHPLSLLWIMKQQGKDLVCNISKYIDGKDRKELNTCDSM